MESEFLLLRNAVLEKGVHPKRIVPSILGNESTAYEGISIRQMVPDIYTHLRFEIRRELNMLFLRRSPSQPEHQLFIVPSFLPEEK